MKRYFWDDLKCAKSIQEFFYYNIVPRWYYIYRDEEYFFQEWRLGPLITKFIEESQKGLNI